jgi:hypothetical protein
MNTKFCFVIKGTGTANAAVEWCLLYHRHFVLFITSRMLWAASQPEAYNRPSHQQLIARKTDPFPTKKLGWVQGVSVVFCHRINDGENWECSPWSMFGLTVSLPPKVFDIFKSNERLSQTMYSTSDSWWDLPYGLYLLELTCDCPIASMPSLILPDRLS